jgi:hypothetical protein
MPKLLKDNLQVMMPQEIKINLITGKVILEHYFRKISLTNKINKLNKHMIFVREKWIKEDQNKDKKK